MTKSEEEYLAKTYDMFHKHWIETNNFEETWEKTKRLLHWYRIGLKDGATEQHKLVLQESIYEEELDELAENIVDTFLNSDYTEGSISYGQLKNLVKAGYRKAKEE